MNINWACNTSGEISITLCYRNDPETLPYIIAIKNMIEATGKKFNEFSTTNKWKWYYPSCMNYIETLEDFVKHEKPMREVQRMVISLWLGIKLLYEFLVCEYND